MPRSTRALWPLALALAVGCPRADWTTVSSAEGGFQVEMPTAPELARHTAESAAGPLEFTIYGSQLAGSAYQVAWVDYPPGTVADPAEVLEAARDGAVAQMAARLVRSESIEIEGHPGLEFEFDVEGRLAGFARMFLVGDRLYQLLLAKEPGDLPGSVGARFLESFRLL